MSFTNRQDLHAIHQSVYYPKDDEQIHSSEHLPYKNKL